MSNRLVVAWPFYKTVPIDWFLNWNDMDKGPLVGTLAAQGIYLPWAMQYLVDEAFEKFGDGWDYLVVYEHDMLVPMDALTRMAQYREEHHIVGSMYFGRRPPYEVMAYIKDGAATGYGGSRIYNPLHPETVKQLVEQPALYEVDAVGMGFTAIHRTVLETWDKNIPMWDAQMPIRGHDLHFCNEAKKQGFKVWLDSGLGCGHLGENAVGLDDNQRCWTEIREQA